MNLKSAETAFLSIAGTVLLLTGAGCARAPVPPPADSSAPARPSAEVSPPAQVNPVPFADTAAYRRLCEIHPDSSAVGRTECVLRDQGVPVEQLQRGKPRP